MFSVTLANQNASLKLNDFEMLAKLENALPEEARVCPGITSYEEVAKYNDITVKSIVATTRKMMITMAPYLLNVRANALWSHHPSRFGSFKDWLSQEGIDISEALASNLINIAVYLLPAAREAGYSIEELTEDIGTSKLALLAPTFRQAAQAGTPLPIEEVREQIEWARSVDWRSMAEARKGHEDSNYAPEPMITFTVTSKRHTSGGLRYDVRGQFDPEQMAYLSKRVRPTWLNEAGQILGEDNIAC